MTQNNIMSLRDCLDFKPLADSFIGFDTIFNQMEYAFNNASNNPYPPYDIYTAMVEHKDNKKTCNEEHTFIEFALAGISKERLQVELKDNILMVKTKPLDYVEIAKDLEENSKKYIRKGIADREFTVQKTISEDLELVSCKMSDGMLIIEFRKKDKIIPKSTIIDIE